MFSDFHRRVFARLLGADGPVEMTQSLIWEVVQKGQRCRLGSPRSLPGGAAAAFAGAESVTLPLR